MNLNSAWFLVRSRVKVSTIITIHLTTETIRFLFPFLVAISVLLSDDYVSRVNTGVCIRVPQSATSLHLIERHSKSWTGDSCRCSLCMKIPINIFILG